jgi:hypothetical protein
MKIKTSLVAALLLVVNLAGSAMAATEVFLFEEEVIKVVTPESYCHMQFPAITDDSLSSDRPILKSATDGDIIDYYGSCDETPLGTDQIWQQKIENQRFTNEQ